MTTPADFPAAFPPLIGGRYALVRRLAVGGMAEVWLARQTGVEGFEKLVVLKRILPHLASNPDFVQMFLDEARTAADLRHTNVASVNDAGTEEGGYFIAMEFLQGQDLAHVVKRCKEQRERIPLQHVLQIVGDAALGLDYVHRKLDRAGAAQNIVHRDVSPQNLFVTYQGPTKLLDFGIASASHRTTHTDSGVVKGKYAYMSPEQFEGAAVDARSDLFSLGVVLWELVTMERLFWKPSDAETLRAVMQCSVPPPSSLWPQCPPALEALILRAVAPRPDHRLAGCGELAALLEQLLETCQLPRSASGVGPWLRSIFPEHVLDPAQAPLAIADLPTRNEKRPQLAGSQTHPTPWRRTHAPGQCAFLGRQPQLERLASHLGSAPRLVTITGGAGEGKSRLAARFLEAHPEWWRGRCWSVELATARSPEEAGRAIMIACGLQLDGICQTDEQVLAQRGRQLAALGPGLLVLDNFELELPGAREAVGQWRAAAPQLSLLVTRRAALGLDGEAVVALGGLDALGPSSDAVRLFASQREGSVALEQVARICQALRGNPLAIELVGAHACRVELSAILRWLEALPPARPAVESSIEWSCQLLSAAERRALGRLSVFRGGFGLDAAGAVLELGGDQEVASVVASLVRQGLLRPGSAPGTPGQVRFELPQSVAAHPLALYHSRGTETARHAGWFLQLADGWTGEGPGLEGERRAALLVERDNLREVFERAPDPSVALRALNGLEPFCRLGPSGAHLAALDRAIAAADASGAAPAVLARAMQQRADVERQLGRSNQALAGLTEALRRARLAEDRLLEGRISCDRAQACFVLGDVDGALAGLERALELATRLGDGALEVKALSLLAVVWVARGELARALETCDAALPLARARGDGVSEARVLGTVGSLFLEQPRYELARAFFDDAVARCEQVNELALKGFLLGKLAQVLAERDDREGAREKVAEALRVLGQVGDRRHEGLFLSFGATLDALDGRREAAEASLAAAGARLEEAGDPLLLTAHALRQMQVRLLARTAPEEGAAALLREVRAGEAGGRPPIAQSDEVRLAVLQLERALLPAQPGPPQPERATPPRAPFRLTGAPVHAAAAEGGGRPGGDAG